MQTYRKVAFHTLGCKLNFSETSTIARLFEEGGYARVSFDEQPDVFVINTCSVTDEADKKCRNFVKRALRINPDAFIAVIGCYAQLKPDEIVQIPGVDIVLGAKEKFNILEHITDRKHNTGQSAWTPVKDVKEFIPGFSYGDRTRTFFKVQDGCDYFCSFCTIPLARGRSRSADITTTVQSVRNLASNGIKEIVLTGVNIGDFGAGTGENFYNLIRALDDVEGISRFRISSIEPNLLTDEIIEFVAQSKKFVPHFHIPLQSGSNSILEAMRRRYHRELYAERVEKIKSLMPDCCIGVDVITGFPGESDEKFKETYEFINRLNISYLHVFTYSERDNTTAVRMENIVPMQVRRERTHMLQILSEKKKRAFYSDFLNTNRTVLFENENNDGFIEGFSDNYLRVRLPFDATICNAEISVNLIKLNADCVFEGELLMEKV